MKATSRNPNEGPVYRTLRQIAQLPLENRLEAFVDRLDMLDQDERDKVVMGKSGDEYSACSNAVRLKILDVGKQWLHDAVKDGKATGKLAALRIFDEAPAQRKAG